MLIQRLELATLLVYHQKLHADRATPVTLLPPKPPADQGIGGIEDLKPREVHSIFSQERILMV
jgi:hypothetical protein